MNNNSYEFEGFQVSHSTSGFSDTELCNSLNISNDMTTTPVL